MKLYVKPVGPIGTNCYIAADDNGRCVMIDPGAQPDRLIAFLEQQKLIPEYILLTHGHYDHIGAVQAIVRRYECKFGIGEKDAEQLSDRTKSLALSHSLPDADYLMTPDLTFKEGDVIEVGEMRFEVIDTPGHTRGGVCYRCGNLLFTGDTLFAGDVGRCDLYGGDYQKILRSVRHLADLPGDYRILPGHGPDSTMEQERRHNQYIRMNLT